MNNLPVASLRLDPSACITGANPAAEGLLATSARRLQGKPLARFLPEAGETLEYAQSQGMTAVKPKATLIDAQGGKTRVSVHINAQTDEADEADDGGVDGGVDGGLSGGGGWTLVILPLIAEDMSARANALKHQAGTITAMNAMLAHEIKNPLAAIRGAAQLMVGAQGDLANLIITESDRISALIDTMQLFTSVEEMGARACNVHTVLSEVLDAIAASAGHGHRLVPDYDPSLPDVQGNAAVLHRVLTNLIKNACEACGAAGGHIQIKTRYALTDKRAVRDGKLKSHLPICVSVIDNGGGVAEEMVDSIFNAFISTKDQSRGLGLAYVAQAVADMGGVIELNTEPGRTEFQLRLPAVEG